ncbi:MAG: hypothetical protein DDT22_01315 [candidate division WS2 bacterium]|nr:hypothetical protein [Candidatus Lithacetigena glycinireducens]
MLNGLRGASVSRLNLEKVCPIEEGRKSKEPINDADKALVRGRFLKELFDNNDSYLVTKAVEFVGRFDAAARTEILSSFQGDLERWLNEKIMSSEDPHRFARAHDFRRELKKAGLTVELERQSDGTEKHHVRTETKEQ